MWFILKRLVVVDVYKGLAILFVIFFHGLAFNMVSDIGSTQDFMGDAMVAITYPLGILGLDGGIFFMMNGVVIAYNMYIQLQIKKKRLNIVAKGIGINFLIMFVLHYFYSIFLSNDLQSHFPFMSIITGSVIEGKLINFSPELLFFNNALTVIALNGLITGLLLVFLWIINGKKFTRIIYWILAGIGIIILFITPIIADILIPFIDLNEPGNLIESGNYILATLIVWLVGPRFPLLPLVIYPIYGMIFGIALAKESRGEESWKFIKNFGITFASIFTIGSVIAVMNLGLPDYTVLHINGLALNFILLAFNVGVMTLGIWGFHFRDMRKRTPDSRKTRGIRRFGLFSLTIFLFDPLIGAIVGRIFQLFIPSDVYSNLYFGVFVYVPVLLLLWWLIFHFWEKVNYKYSIEWLLGKLGEKMRGYKSERFTFRQSIIDPLGVLTISKTSTVSETDESGHD